MLLALPFILYIQPWCVDDLWRTCSSASLCVCVCRWKGVCHGGDGLWHGTTGTGESLWSGEGPLATADLHANASVRSNTFHKRKQNLLDGYEPDLSILNWSFECVIKGLVSSGKVTRRVLVLKEDGAPGRWPQFGFQWKEQAVSTLPSSLHQLRRHGTSSSLPSLPASRGQKAFSKASLSWKIQCVKSEMNGFFWEGFWIHYWPWNQILLGSAPSEIPALKKKP